VLVAVGKGIGAAPQVVGMISSKMLCRTRFDWKRYHLTGADRSGTQMEPEGGNDALFRVAEPRDVLT
jgi:hypothetical protein